jgi:hypothetical protein
MRNALAGPGSFRKVAGEWGKRPIFIGWVREHDAPVGLCFYVLRSPRSMLLRASFSGEKGRKAVAGKGLPNCHATLGPATDQ